MKLYGLEIDNLPQDELEKNLKKIYEFQQERIEALKKRHKDYLEGQGVTVTYDTKYVVH